MVTNRDRFLKEFPAALHEGSGAVFIGAGVSMGAGYPSWASLLTEIGEELGVNARDIQDLAALAQWHIRETGNATGVRRVIKREIAPDHPIPDVLRTIARLPVRHIWTTNYDRLVERAFDEARRPLDAIIAAENLVLRTRPGAARLYKMHGSIERLDDIVISTDDYELFRRKRGAFLPVLQGQLSSMSMLFVGLSLTDPNVRHVLSLIRESFTDAPPEHFAIVRPPKRDDFDKEDNYKARLSQHKLWAKDLSRYGLVAVEVDDYDEVPQLLHEIERRVASKRVWVSGSWPIDLAIDMTARIYRFCEELGGLVASQDKDLISGTGLLIGPATVSGFLDVLRDDGGWDIDRRLIVRSFPQPIPGAGADHDRWASLRGEMARNAGITIFVGGLKSNNGLAENADGVIKEYDAARVAGSFLLPVGAFGGSAQAIADELLGSPAPVKGQNAIRPTDDELTKLGDPSQTNEQLLSTISVILKRLAG